MRFAVLGSGSRGNAYLVEAGETLLLVDAGFSRRELTRRMARLGRSLDQVTALLISHEHGDHCSALAQLLKRESFPVLATRGTLRQLGMEDDGRGVPLDGKPVEAGDLHLHPFAVPHDAAEPVGFVFESAEGRRLGLASDLGIMTTLVRHRLQKCHVLALEANHDEAMLRTGPYPFPVKQRIRSSEGHLSNLQLCRALPDLVHAGLHTLVPLHLSRTNNDPILVKYGVSEVLRKSAGSGVGCLLSRQDDILPYLEV